MSFSGVEYRSQEVETVKTFLIYSVIGSLALHIGLLSSGLGSWLTTEPKQRYEPIELVIIDPTEPKVEEAEKPPAIIPPKIKTSQPTKIVTSTVTPVTQAKIEPKITPSLVAPQQQPKVKTVATSPVPQPPQPAIPPPQESVANLESILTSKLSTSPITVPQTNQGSEKLRETLSGLRNSRVTQESATTNNNTNNTRLEPSPVAVAPTTPTPPPIKTNPETKTPPNNNPSANSRGSGNGRAACSQCNAQYPEFARRRGIEGRVEVAVDTDAQGNVTNVRIVGSSGNSRLDDETLRQARNWKLKPSESGRQGVSIATEFALQGSRRHQRVQQRKRSRQTATSTPSSTSNTNTPATNTTKKPRIRRTTTPVQNTATGSSSTRRTSPPTPGNVRESLRRVRSQQTTKQTTTTSASPDNTSSSSQNKLRSLLRNSRQTSPSE